MESNKRLVDFDNYNRPKECGNCGGIMVFQGVGEYKCEECGTIAYDDYGKARCYIEQHRGATAAEIEAGTGVKQRTIRNLLKEGRLEVTADSKVFLHCEICKKEIRMGRFCPECEKNYHRRMEEQQRQIRNAGMQVFGLGMEETAGEKRFRRER